MKFKVLAMFVLLLLFCIPAQAQSLKANISWSAVTTYSDGAPIEAGQVVKYDVWRASASDLSDSAKLNTADVATPGFVDTGITPNRTYYYQVLAYILPALPSEKSDPVAVRTFPPGKPGSIVVVTTQ